MAHWEDSAACRGKPQSIFFPQSGPGNADAARLVCAGCPVRKECLEFAISTNQEHGIWGGLNFNERRRLAEGAVLRIGRCGFCLMPFTFWWEKGKAPTFCSNDCLKSSRNRSRKAWRERRMQEAG